MRRGSISRIEFNFEARTVQCYGMHNRLITRIQPIGVLVTLHSARKPFAYDRAFLDLIIVMSKTPSYAKLAEAFYRRHLLPSR
jgi:hypothetical protein